MHTSAKKELLIGLGLLSALVILVSHISVYRFLCDDAFISFRYARNLADGHGLVFNPGFERVEGYTNFLWVLILSGFSVLGLAPEIVANPLLILLSLTLWGLAVGLAYRTAPRRYRLEAMLICALLLAATRSFAVWSTSGLETRLFALLIFAGAVRLLTESGQLKQGRRDVRPIASALFALAALTRPEGPLLGGCAFAIQIVIHHRDFRERFRWLVSSGAVFLIPFTGHLLFRYSYYRDWLPNTYYAKVSGSQSSWDDGVGYLTTFVLEYAAYLWIPALVAALAYHGRNRSIEIPLTFAAAIGPYILYVVKIGGDHFEYRPLDLCFPFIYVLISHGIAYLLVWKRMRPGIIAYAMVMLMGIVALPTLTHLQFPSEYIAGFPGMRTGETAQIGAEDARADHYLQPENSSFFKLPGLRFLLESYRQALLQTTGRFAGIRQEEHKLFSEKMRAAGQRLRQAIQAGKIPRDIHVAISCVGVVPYYSDLRTLDRFGLTDAHVARGDATVNFSAHSKSASKEYAREAGVDIWAMTEARLLVRGEEFLELLDRAYYQDNVLFADLGDGWFFIAEMLQGIERAKLRLANLELRSVYNVQAVREAERRAQAESL